MTIAEQVFVEPHQSKMPLYSRLARCLFAIENCRKAGNVEWLDKHEDRLARMVRELPSGSGIDAGCTIESDECSPNKIVIHTAFHHMDDNGCYDGWSEHKIIVTPDLAFGFDIRVTGRDKRQIKEYLGEVFHAALSEEAPEYSEG